MALIVVHVLHQAVRHAATEKARDAIVKNITAMGSVRTTHARKTKIKEST